ncbi:MAG: hypothetical protein C0596_12740 [Marinilabiliales bacterium]|nr:MAG: hypothetical protein C0596_12740 [Marinilabiliales bacterium]
MFTNLLKTKLAMNYSIFNLGVCGSHTQREYDSLLSYPVQPDIIILAYYHNDIESAMNAKGISPNITNPKDELCAFSRLFVNNSLFFNYMFTKYAKSKISAQFMESKNNDILAYLNEDLWQKQTEYLDNFYNYSIENNVRLIIIFFPAMGEGITFTHELAGVKLEEYCIDKGIQYLDLYPKIQNLEVYERVANPMDHHPSAEVNSIIADLITENL